VTDTIRNRRGKCVPTLKAGLVSLLRVDIALFYSKRDTLRRRKRNVNARPPVARQRTGAAITPWPTIAHGEFRRAGHGHLPPTFTLWKSINMVRTILRRSNIKVDNVHNPTQRFKGCKHARACGLRLPSPTVRGIFRDTSTGCLRTNAFSSGNRFR